MAEHDEEVLWKYDPQSPHTEGSYLHGLPRGVDLTRRHLAQAGHDPDAFEPDPQLYRRAGETRAQRRHRGDETPAARAAGDDTRDASGHGED